jgi:hypothetical protein
MHGRVPPADKVDRRVVAVSKLEVIISKHSDIGYHLTRPMQSNGIRYSKRRSNYAGLGHSCVRSVWECLPRKAKRTLITVVRARPASTVGLPATCGRKCPSYDGAQPCAPSSRERTLHPQAIG